MNFCLLSKQISFRHNTRKISVTKLTIYAGCFRKYADFLIVQSLTKPIGKLNFVYNLAKYLSKVTLDCALTEFLNVSGIRCKRILVRRSVPTQAYRCIFSVLLPIYF